MDNLIMTLPIKPQSKTNIGMLIAPTLMNVLSDISLNKSMMCFNLLHSYQNKDDNLQEYINELKKQKIKYDEIFIDKNRINDLLEIIEKLKFQGVIRKEQQTIFRCPCGRIDILEQALHDIEFGKLYYELNGKYFCKCCKQECKPYNEFVLTFNFSKDIDDSINIVPTYLKNETMHFTKIFKGNKILISKKRNTGYQLVFDNEIFNIDIDFIWLNYFQLFLEKNKIIVASNHQVFQMYLLNYINRIVKNDNISFIASPYMNNNLNAKIEFDNKTDEYYKKLFILYNLSWKNKSCNWSQSVISYLNKINEDDRKKLYYAILNQSRVISKNIDNDIYLEKILTKCANMQNNLNYVKKLEKK